MKKFKVLISILIITAILLSLLLIWLIYQLANKPSTRELEPINADTQIEPFSMQESEYKEEYLENNKDYTFEVDKNYFLTNETELPHFITFENNKITVNGVKNSIGTHTLKFQNGSKNELNFLLHIESPNLNFESLETQINSILGDKASSYTIYLENLLNGQHLDINKGKIVEPASIAKLPVAILTLKDVDAGKISLADTYPITNQNKFGTAGNLGNLPSGTEVKISTYLEELIYHSDNNAWFVLIEFLGGNLESVVPRTINELGVNPLFLYPPQGTSEGVGKILKDLYFRNILSEKSTDYLISLFENSDPWTRNAIGSGLPSEAKFINKIGTLDDSGKVSYQDGAIVWGERSDYVLVIMNEDIDWVTGQQNIKMISELVYNFLN